MTFAPPGSDQQTLCSQVEALGPPAPQWFATAYLAFLGPHAPVERSLSIRDASAGVIAASVDPDAALRRAWREISTVVEIAVIMAGGIAVLAAVMIGHALLPARAIIDALRKLEEGHLALRLSKFKSTEFNHIANAVNRLAATLRQANSERLALTNRLFQVQEEERRALARDLHDEFGQALAATSALATLIETGAPSDRPDIAKDARAITRAQKQMMEALRRAAEQGASPQMLQALRQMIEQRGMEPGSEVQFQGNNMVIRRRVPPDSIR